MRKHSRGDGPIPIGREENAQRQAKRHVCLIEWTDPSTRKKKTGSGFLVGPRSILTNYHVLQGMEMRFEEIEIFFDYELDEEQNRIEHSRKVTLDKNPQVAFSNYEEDKLNPAHDELDYIVLNLASDIGLEHGRGWQMLPGTKPDPRQLDLISLLQHPSGQTLSKDTGLMLGFNKGKNRIYYKTHTSPGSSGSPCFDKSYSLVAIHQGEASWLESEECNRAIPAYLIRTDLVVKKKWGEIRSKEYQPKQKTISSLTEQKKRTGILSARVNLSIKIIILITIMLTACLFIYQHQKGKKFGITVNSISKKERNIAFGWFEWGKKSETLQEFTQQFAVSDSGLGNQGIPKKLEIFYESSNFDTQENKHLRSFFKQRDFESAKKLSRKIVEKHSIRIAVLKREIRIEGGNAEHKTLIDKDSQEENGELIAHLENELIKNQAHLIDALLTQASCEYETQEWSNAASTLKKCIDIFDAESDPIPTIIVSFYLSELLHKSTKYLTALENNKKLEKLIVKTLGKDHPYNYAVKYEIAKNVNRLNKNQSIKLYDDLIKDLSSEYGSSNPITLRVKLSLAIAQYLKDRNEAEAISRYLPLLEKIKNTTGKKSKLMKEGRVSLATAYSNAGNLKLAIELANENISSENPLAEKFSENLFHSQRALAVALNLNRDYDESKKLFEAILKYSSEYYPEGHYRILSTKMHLVTVYTNLGEVDRRDANLNEILDKVDKYDPSQEEIRCQILSVKAALLLHDPDLSILTENEIKKRCREAKDLLLDLIPRQLDFYTSRTADITRNEVLLVEAMLKLGEIEDAKSKLIEIESYDERNIPADSLRQILWNKALIYRLDNEVDKALEMVERILEILKENNYKPSDYNVINMTYHKGAFLLQLKRLQECYEVWSELIPLYASRYGDQDRRTLNLRLDFSFVLIHLGEVDAAKNLCENEIRKANIPGSNKGIEHYLFLNNLGDIAEREGDLERALLLYKDSKFGVEFHNPNSIHLQVVEEGIRSVIQKINRKNQ